MFAGRMLQKTPNASYTPRENGRQGTRGLARGDALQHDLPRVLRQRAVPAARLLDQRRHELSEPDLAHGHVVLALLADLGVPNQI
jgi:hypothetical protein